MVSDPSLAVCASACILVLWWLCRLAWRDSLSRRIPTSLVLTGIVVACYYSAVTGSLSTALLGGGLLALCYLVPSLLNAQGIGGGDIKVAFPIGMIAAAQSWSHWWIATIVPFCVTAVVGIGQYLLVTRTSTPSLNLKSGHVPIPALVPTSHHSEGVSACAMFTVPHDISLSLVTALLMLSPLVGHLVD